MYTVKYDDALHQMQHSKASLNTDRVGLADDLKQGVHEHGRLNMLLPSTRRPINFLEASHVQGRPCAPIHALV